MNGSAAIDDGIEGAEITTPVEGEAAWFVGEIGVVSGGGASRAVVVAAAAAGAGVVAVGGGLAHKNGFVGETKLMNGFVAAGRGVTWAAAVVAVVEHIASGAAERVCVTREAAKDCC